MKFIKRATAIISLATLSIWNGFSESDGMKNHQWDFAEYGASTNSSINTYQVLDKDNLSVKLNSCIVDEKTGLPAKKGGKFMSYFDGISYYYTVIDPKTENFTLSADVYVDYINPNPDGQEGFGILASDSLGTNGAQDEVHYTNSAAVMAWKFSMTDAERKKHNVKDGMGARFVSGITKEVMAKGDTEVTTHATKFAQAFDYGKDAKIQSGKTYRITLKKDNTGYHSIYSDSKSVKEYIMYDPSKLTQLDEDHVYLGFVVARGCNATFKNIDFKITDPATDAPAIAEPKTLVPLEVLMDSPSATSDKKYQFAFVSNSDGWIHIEDKKGKVLVNKDAVKASTKKENNDYKKNLKLKEGDNQLVVTFTPDEKFQPCRNGAISQWSEKEKTFKESAEPVTMKYQVRVKSFKGKEIYASPKGSQKGDGSLKKPLDLQTAIDFALPGQTVLLLPGTYKPSKPVIIQRGNNGSKKKRKILTSQEGSRAVLDMSGFKTNTSGFELFGDYWTVKNIDVTKTNGNQKGFQIGGSHNIVQAVDTYLNGDTGLQISGRSSEHRSKWPSYNLVIGCESFANCDPAKNNADGFASKLTSGEGNVFRNCVSHHNVDDGWDFYAKVETGRTGAVLVENCISYANGQMMDRSGRRNANGFKLGGEGLAVKHIIRNCLAFDNALNGITSNSNPALIVENCTSVHNDSSNYQLYGKGKVDEKHTRTFTLTNVISINGGQADRYNERPEVFGESTYLWDGKKCENSKKEKLDESIFVSADPSSILNGYNKDGSFNRLKRNADNTFDIGNLFKIRDENIKVFGAAINHQ